MYEYLLPSLIFFLFPDVAAVHQNQVTGLRPVESESVVQYWNTRCQASATLTEIPDTIELFPGLPIVDIYLEFEGDIYFVEQFEEEALPRAYFEELQLLNHQRQTDWKRVFYIVAPDETNPGAGRLDLLAGTLDVRTTCAVHLPILAPYKD